MMDKCLIGFLCIGLKIACALHADVDQKRDIALKGHILANDAMMEGEGINSLQNKKLLFWTEDYKAAFETSRESKKAILIAFTGLDWCPWSQKLFADVLSAGEFTKLLKDELMLVKVDYPENLDQNNDLSFLKEKYNIQEFPTLMLVDATGDEISKIGYLPMPADELAKYIKKNLSHYRELKETISACDLLKVTSEELKNLYTKAVELHSQNYKDKILHAGLQTDKSPFFLLEKYTALVEGGKGRETEAEKLRQEINLRDPQNSHGSQLKLAILDFQSLSSKFKKNDKVNKVIEPLVNYIKTFGSKDAENLWKVEMMISQFFFSKNIVDHALSHAEASYKTAPENVRPQIAKSIEYLKTCQSVQ